MSTAVLTKPKRATDSTTTGLSEVAAKEKTATAKKTIASSKKEETEEVSWEELQNITKKLIEERKLKPFDKKYIYGDL